MSKYKKFLVMGDWHVPYEDRAALACVIKLGVLINPDKIILEGDILDMWQLSKFDKEPSRQYRIDKDIKQTYDRLMELRDTFPKAQIIYLFGNHEDRLRRYRWRVARELNSLKMLKLENLLKLDDLHIKYYTRDKDVHQENALLFTHGSVVSQDSGATARRMVRKYGMSLVMGHTHRLGSYYKTDFPGVKGGWENGCLCDPTLAKEWGQGFPDWQQGCSVVYMRGQRFDVKPAFISKGQLLFGGKEIKG